MGRFLVGEPDAGFSEVGAELVTLGNRGFKGALGVGLLPGQVGDHARVRDGSPQRAAYGGSAQRAAGADQP